MKITRNEKHITVQAEYNSVFVGQARNLAGKWHDQDKTWVFDIRDEADVLQACYHAYGEDGIRTNKCDVQVTLPTGYSVEKGTICLFGRQIARAFNRDSGAKVFGGVVVKAGGFSSGGSAKNWVTRAQAGTVFVLRDVSRDLVEMEASHDTYGDAVIEILQTTVSSKPVADRAALEAERDRLQARLAEINAELGGLGNE